MTADQVKRISRSICLEVGYRSLEFDSIQRLPRSSLRDVGFAGR